MISTEITQTNTLNINKKKKQLKIQKQTAISRIPKIVP